MSRAMQEYYDYQAQKAEEEWTQEQKEKEAEQAERELERQQSATDSPSRASDEELKEIIERSVPAHPFSEVLIDVESYRETWKERDERSRREQSQPATQSATEEPLDIIQLGLPHLDHRLLDFLDSLPIPEGFVWTLYPSTTGRGWRLVTADWFEVKSIAGADDRDLKCLSAREAIYRAMVEAESQSKSERSES